MMQLVFRCPFCKAPAFRTRYMLWRHMHECMRKRKQDDPTVALNQNNLAVVSIANS
ncbi:MAG: hypothetical protein NWE95_05550 [Candidatus Bathyarchaeota archaeon]|nr:hypothetical protein [Candidatus Bathyarchaeota archaeon]